MDFKIRDRDCTSRLCEVEILKNKIITPNILFLNISRFKYPDFAEIVITENNNIVKKPIINLSDIITINNKLNPENIENNIKNKYNNNILTISNSQYLLNKKLELINLITDIKEKFGDRNLIYLPAISDLSNISLFSYIGIDLFDCTSAIMLARNRLLMFSTGNKKISKLKQIPCSCKYCIKYVNEPSLIPFENILNHNYLKLLNEIVNIRNEIRNGNLRDLVEIRVKSDTNSTALLRIFDNKYYDYIEKYTPMRRNEILIANTKESLNRPEIRRFQDRVIKRYIKPKSTKILLLLPCSAKKPYSFSKSHKKFRDQINKINNSSIIHELIITSPIGIVPRELELIYPASNYDIPITNLWDEEEKKMILRILSNYLKLNQYDKFIIHLPKNITNFISDLFIDPIITKIVGSPTSKESLSSLFKILKDECGKYPNVNKQKRKIEDITSLLSYQFNKNIADELLNKCKIKGKYPYYKIFLKNIQLGMITKERGFASLTLDGANIIYKLKKNNIEIYDDFQLKGSVFAPGVKFADQDIRIGDEVFIIQNERCCGVGVAQMNGIEMMKLNYGEAVKVRHKV